VSEPGYAAQLDSLRSTAKWIVAALGAVAVVLVAGLQLSDLGALSFSSWRFYAAVAAAVIALAGVIYMIREASVVLTNEWLTLAAFADAPDDGIVKKTRKANRARKVAGQLQLVERKLELSRDELFGYGAASIYELQARLSECDERIWQVPSDSKEASDAQRQAALLRQAARETVQYANYYSTLELFQRMRLKLGWAAVVVAISVGVFAYSGNMPGRPTSHVQSTAKYQAR
jgi:hypothetical protein